MADSERLELAGHRNGGRDRRRLSFSLRDWRVRSKLIAVLVIPAVAFLVVAGFGISTTVSDARAFDRESRLAALGRQATALVHELQSERDRSAGYIDSGRRVGSTDLAGDQRSVDQAASAYRTAEAELYDDLGVRLMSRFDTVRSQIKELPGLRGAVASRSLTRQAIFNEYSKIVDALLDVDAEIAQTGGDENLAQSVRAFNDLSRAKEATARVRGTLYAISYRKAFAFGEAQQFADLVAQQQAAFEQFQVDANEQQRTLFANLVRGQPVLIAFRTQQAAQARQSSADLGVDPEQWFAATTTQVELMRGVETQLLENVIKQSQDLSTTEQRRSALNALLIAIILAVALLALLMVARSMARPLQRLRSRALDIAEHRLPEAVEQLSTSEGGELDIRVEPIGIRSRDEIGQVSQAVDAIQQVAVRLATEQAALRQSIGDMFTNLARRSQTLIDRQLELIEDLERNEEAPETLEHLFRLDHLATRMRRNAEDLIVLSGAEPGRHWAQPMTLVDVVRAATAEVEEYQRVELLPLADLEVAGSASIDVIHLLAELVENATVFSPPNTKVQIAGQALPHGYVIEIEDRGLGMSEEELLAANERLADPPEIDFALSRVLGLYVVGRLAQRHGIRVQLRHSWYGGITALTLLPHSVLVWPDEPRAIPEHLAVAPAELPSPPGRMVPPERLTPPERMVPPERLAPPERLTPRERPDAEPAEPAEEPPVEAGDHLPIFEAARSDWFIAEPAGQTQEQESPPPPPPPPRPFRPAPPLRQPASTFQEPQAPVGAGATAAPAVDGPAPPFRPSTLQRPYATPTPEPHPDDQETHAVPVTQAGLPRRIPRANLAPGMIADPPEAPEASAGRTPDEVRSILSSYRTGLERGRLAAGDLEGSDQPDEAP